MRGALRTWWEGVVRATHPKWDPQTTTQGYYIFAPDGTPALWDNYIPRISMVVEKGLEMSRTKKGVGPGALPDKSLAGPPAPPPNTSIVRLYTRIKPLPANAGPLNDMLGRDYMWVLQDELKSIVESATAPGKSVPLPPSLGGRLTLFHLVDNVRGTIWGWQAEKVKKSSYTVKLVSTDGKIKKYAFTGEYAKQDSHPPQWTDRGQEGKVDGEIDIDTTTFKLVRFRALGKSTAWSDFHYGPVLPPAGKYPIVTAIVEANDELAQRVPPEAAGTGHYYLNAPVMRGR